MTKRDAVKAGQIFEKLCMADTAFREGYKKVDYALGPEERKLIKDAWNWFDEAKDIAEDLAYN